MTGYFYKFKPDSCGYTVVHEYDKDRYGYYSHIDESEIHDKDKWEGHAIGLDTLEARLKCGKFHPTSLAARIAGMKEWPAQRIYRNWGYVNTIPAMHCTDKKFEMIEMVSWGTNADGPIDSPEIMVPTLYNVVINIHSNFMHGEPPKDKVRVDHYPGLSFADMIKRIYKRGEIFQWAVCPVLAPDMTAKK